MKSEWHADSAYWTNLKTIFWGLIQYKDAILPV